MYIVINGGGKIGEYLARIMLEQDNEVAIIEEQATVADRLSGVLNGRYLIICGDGCTSHFQEEADIRRADVFVSTTGQDDANLVSCEIATRVFDVPRCIARVNNPKNLRIFREVGIECVSSTTLIATIIQEDAVLGGIGVLSSLSQGNVMLSEVTVPRMKHHDNETGILARHVPVPEGCLLVAVSKGDDVEVVGSDTTLLPGDVVTIATDTDKKVAAYNAVRQL
ncbi:MAG: TrkA family potassium uptake protein [Eggerthellaceae bacterium]|nr:TrkA family potassium uptake protein [Eggerthellaceae bacterium]